MNVGREQMSHLADLADILLQRRVIHASVVVPFVGAGASAGAELPTGDDLKAEIYSALVRGEQEGALARALNGEASVSFHEKANNGILNLSLFEFAAVVSRLGYLKAEMHGVISAQLAKSVRRPLVYELLAHLAKHRFLDHLVSLNFDELLDDALKDELSDRLHSVASPEEIPGPNQRLRQDPCYLVKPFGSLSTDRYKLEPRDVDHYERGSIWDFVRHRILTTMENKAPEVVLVLIGYKAVEGAFKQLIEELLGEGRRVTVFFISRRTAPSGVLTRKLPQLSVLPVHLEADIAFDLLVQIMEHKFKEKRPSGVWIPGARHRVISALRHSDIFHQDDRFRVEVLLQALKSRGFFTVEAVADIPRIRRYDGAASVVIEDMCQKGVLAPEKWKFGNVRPENLRQDFRLRSHRAEDLMPHMTTLPPETTVTEWGIRRTGQSYEGYPKKMPLSRFLDNRFAEILTAPEIEVSSDFSRSTRWLFKNPKRLTSISDLTEATNRIFGSALNSEEKIELKGVWTTGEWLFHEKGWAWASIGQPLMESLANGRVSMEIVVAKGPECNCERSTRAGAVLKRLAESIRNQSCKVTFLDWWKLNRCITLLRWGANEEGIYMRRHLATPLVAPVQVSGKECGILDDMFQLYVEKAAESPPPEDSKQSAA